MLRFENALRVVAVAFDGTIVNRREVPFCELGFVAGFPVQVDEAMYSVPDFWHREIMDAHKNSYYHAERFSMQHIPLNEQEL